MSGRKREGDPNSWEEFLALEQKERLLGVEKYFKSAGYSVKNEGNLNGFKNNSLNVMKELIEKYPHISLI